MHKNNAHSTKTASPQAAVAIRMQCLPPQKIFHQFIRVNFRRAEAVKLLCKLCNFLFVERNIANYGRIAFKTVCLESLTVLSHVRVVYNLPQAIIPPGSKVVDISTRLQLYHILYSM